MAGTDYLAGIIIITADTLARESQSCCLVFYRSHGVGKAWLEGVLWSAPCTIAYNIPAI